MPHALYAFILAAALFAGMLILLDTGRRVGRRRLATEGESARAGAAAVDGAIFGLLGLLIAFTFSGAAVRFDQRRVLIVDEANAIGTAWLRIDLVPASAQPALRDLFRRYVDSRLAIYRALPDIDAARSELARAAKLQNEIWSASVSACQTAPIQSAPMLFLPALNQMFDITNTRTVAAETHPPAVVFILLFGLAFASALVAGYGMAAARKPSWIHLIAFATVVAISVYVILDLEYPRLGLIRIDAADKVLVELRQSMS